MQDEVLEMEMKSEKQREKEVRASKQLRGTK